MIEARRNGNHESCHAGAPMKKARFLVLRGGAIGDFIVTLPVLAALRERWPDAYIEVIGYPHIASLALAGGLADQVESLDRAEIARFFSARPAFTPAQSERIRSFDLALSYLHDSHDVVRNNLLLAGAKQVLCGSPLIKEGPASRALLKPLESLAIYPDRDIPSLTLRPELVEKGRLWLNEKGLRPPILAIHPGSGSLRKNWPLDRFLDVARRAAADGRSVFFIAGEADEALRVRLSALNPPVCLLTNATLVDVAGALSNCESFAGNDSGITHLAAALNLPVVALFGPSDASIWGPRGHRCCVIQAPEGNLNLLEPDSVWAALLKLRQT